MAFVVLGMRFEGQRARRERDFPPCPMRGGGLAVGQCLAEIGNQ